ncbi:MAG: TonB-dependent receptor [Saprospiraceae bacterium]|nr:TonB-dependent receptor [Saprospiraceae bacterium]
MKFLTILSLVLLASVSLLAQNINLAGKVTDPLGNPLEGASIYLPASEKGAVSKKDGSFSISNLQAGELSIRISFIGYQTLQTTINLTEGLDEVFPFILEEKAIYFDMLTVSATRADKNAPFTYTNLDKEALESRNLGQDVPFLLRYTPSAVVTSDAGTGIGYTGIRIRGTDPTRINITINGIPYNDAESQGAFWVDLPDFVSSTNDIQIQRGVGTSTNGAAAFGASINLNTNTQAEEAYGEVNASVGSFGTFKTNIKAGTGLMNGFSLDGRWSSIQSDGFIDRGSAELQSWYASGAWMNDHTSIRLTTFSGKEITYQAWCGVPWQTYQSGNRTNNPCGLKSDGGFHENQVDDYTQNHYQLHFNHSFSDQWNLNAALHYTKGSGFYEEWREGESLEDYALEPVITDTDTILEDNLIRRRWLDNDFYGGIFSLNYQGEKWNWTLGGGWNQYDGLHFGEAIWTASQGEIENPPTYYENDALKTDFNIFSKQRYAFSDKLALFTDFQYRMVDYQFEGLDRNGNPVPQDATFNFFNPKAGLTFTPDANSRYYVSFAVGNREPNRDDFTDSSPDSRPKHESLYNTELGYEKNWQNASLGVAAYHMYYQNQLVLTGQINDVGAYTRINVPNSYRAGLEVFGGWEFMDNLTLGGNLTYSRNRIAEFTEYIDNWATWEQEAVVHTNAPLSFSPELMGSLDLTYNILGNVDFHDLDVSLMGKYVGKQYLDNTGNENAVLDPYFFSDLQISYTWKSTFVESISLVFLVRNVLDNQFVSNGWTYRFLSPGYDPRPDDAYARLENGDRYNLTGLYPQAGRNYLLGIKFRI